MKYKLTRGSFSAIVNGKRVELAAGDTCELSDTAYKAFSDKFEPVKVAAKKPPVILEGVPFREELIANKITKLENIPRAKEALVKLTNIGESRATEILEWLKQKDNG